MLTTWHCWLLVVFTLALGLAPHTRRTPRHTLPQPLPPVFLAFSCHLCPARDSTPEVCQGREGGGALFVCFAGSSPEFPKKPTPSPHPLACSLLGILAALIPLVWTFLYALMSCEARSGSGAGCMQPSAAVAAPLSFHLSDKGCLSPMLPGPGSRQQRIKPYGAPLLDTYI